MAISIDWVSGVITVPRADMTLIQSTPVEVREINVEDFRAEINDLKDNPDGRPWTRIYNHNTTVNIGGITLARVIEIIPPYTITFEDGQYAVNIVGGNTNFIDRTNPNQVSLRSNNSAGLIDAGGGEDTLAPTWDTTTGIINAYQNGSLINITWGSASDANEVRYNIYISKFNVDVFNSANLLTASQGHFLALGNDTSEPL